MKLGRAVAVAAVGYLFGSLSSGRLVARFAAPGEDVTTTSLELPGGGALEFEGVSATSIAARSGPRWGMVTGTLDMLKAFLPTWCAKKRWPGEPYAAIAATAVIAGHNYPIYHGFKGGRGMAPFMGGMIALDPIAIPITQAAGIAVGVIGFRDVWAAYTGGLAMTVPWFVWRRRPAEAAHAVAANVLFTFSSRRELRAYIEKRRSGEIGDLSSFREFADSYDVMTGAEQTPE